MTGQRARLRRVRERLSEAQNHRCAYCGVRVSEKGRTMATLDHVKPKSAGGATTQDNLVIACADCNVRKGWQNAWKFHRLKERSLA